MKIKPDPKKKEEYPLSIESSEEYQRIRELHDKNYPKFEAQYGSTIRNYREFDGYSYIGIYTEEACLYPERSYKNDIALDLKAAMAFTMSPGSVARILTGIRLLLPNKVHAIIKGRSIMAKQGISVLGGVIDNGYRGEIEVTLLYGAVLTSTAMHRQPGGIIKRTTFKPAGLSIKKGDRIAQLIFLPIRWQPLDYALYPIFDIKDIPETDRGEKGHGSTGR